MSMTLGDMTSIATLTQNYLNKSNSTSDTSSATGAAAANADPLAQALGLADKRIATQISQTNVQLSGYGQIKSGYASLASSGTALTKLDKTSSSADVTKAAQSFVDAFNSTNSAVASATGNASGSGSAASAGVGSAANAGALANEPLARLAGNDLRRIVSNGGGLGELQKIGISVGQNGSLTIDSKALGAALQANPDTVKSTLAKLGQAAASTANNELSAGGAVGSAVNSLTSRAKNLAAQQTQQQNLAASAQTAIQQSAAGGYGGISAGIAAYMKAFSL